MPVLQVELQEAFWLALELHLRQRLALVESASARPQRGQCFTTLTETCCNSAGTVQALLRKLQQLVDKDSVVLAIVAIGVPRTTAQQLEKQYEAKGLVIMENPDSLDDIYIYVDPRAPHELGASSLMQTLLGDICQTYGAPASACTQVPEPARSNRHCRPPSLLWHCSD